MFKFSYRPFLFLIFLSSQSLDSFSQDATKNFELVLPKNKAQSSYYNKIAFLDSRVGNKEIGMVDAGILRNRDATLILKAPFQDQLTAVVNSLIDSTAKNGELLFQLNRLSFAETNGTRYCYLIAGLYARNEAGYKKLASIDTVSVFRFAIPDILIQEESKLITGFIATNLQAEATGTTVYAINEVAHIDSIEMRGIPVFNTENYTDGLYTSYESFMAQSPDKQAIVDADRDGTISSVKTLDSSGKKNKSTP